MSTQTFYSSIMMTITKWFAKNEGRKVPLDLRTAIANDCRTITKQIASEDTSRQRIKEFELDDTFER